MMKAWWEQLYIIQHQIWPAWSECEEAATEKVYFINDVIGKNNSLKVLDLGCGTGKEAILFGELGHDVLGLDISPELIANARKKLSEKKNKITTSFLEGDFRDFTTSNQFDLIISLDSSLNIFRKDEIEKLLFNYRVQILKHGGVFIMEQLRKESWEKVNKTFKIKSEKMGPGYTQRTYSFDFEKQMLIDEVEYVSDDGKVRNLPTQRLFLFSEHELFDMFKEAGFTSVELIKPNLKQHEHNRYKFTSKSDAIFVVGYNG